MTYFRSRSARMEESKDAGGGTFYDRVYEAARPELFFKAAAWRVRGPHAPIRIRADAKWNVPEPELALYVNVRGKIVGYTIGNDVSSRDIEGENPLYLPQAKVYDGSCALGPGVYVTDDPLPPSTTISLRITRGSDVAFQGEHDARADAPQAGGARGVSLSRDELPDRLRAAHGHGHHSARRVHAAVGGRVEITIEPIGTLVNTVE